MNVSSRDKARALRLERLRAMVETRMDQPAAALETLLTELKGGEEQGEFWEQLHAASLRDGKEQELATAYHKVTTRQRLRELGPEAQTSLLMHAADFHQGVLGDLGASKELLLHVLAIVPGHPEAFARLEKRFESASNKRELIELYAAVSQAPPKPADQLARATLNLLTYLPAENVISEETCQKLLAYVPVSTSILSAIETHCRKTSRFELAGTLIERAIESYELSRVELVDLRRRLLDLFEESNVRGRSIAHVEWLLEQDPADVKARAAVERLITHREVGMRATNALRAAKRKAPFV